MGLFAEGACLISYVYPAQNPELVEALAAKSMTVIGAWQHKAGAGRGEN